MRRYMMKVLKKKRERIRMQAGGPDLHPPENHIQVIKVAIEISKWANWKIMDPPPRTLQT